MTAITHPLAEDYMRRLRQSARLLPAREREDLVTEIGNHLAVGLSPGASEAEVRNLLDRLGAPEDIVAAAEPTASSTRRGAREVFALILLVTGFPPIIGWLIGVGLLVWSPLWTWRQKLLGIAVWPGGYTIVLGVLGLAAGTQTCSSVPGEAGIGTLNCTGSGSISIWAIAAIVVLVLAPLIVAGYLYRAAGHTSGAQ